MYQAEACRVRDDCLSHSAGKSPPSDNPPWFDWKLSEQNTRDFRRAAIFREVHGDTPGSSRWTSAASTSLRETRGNSATFTPEASQRRLRWGQWAG